MSVSVGQGVGQDVGQNVSQGVGLDVGQDVGEEELKDPYCDPESPVQVQFQEVTSAAYKIRGGIERTPCAVS